MRVIVAVLLLWCIPSVLLLGSASWQRYKAQLRIKALHLDQMFVRNQRVRGLRRHA